MGDSRRVLVLERVAIVLASLAVSLGAIAILSGFFAGRDAAGVSIGTGPGVAYPDLGDAHLRPGESHPAYNSDPPTSGAHVPVPVTRNMSRLSDDQLLEALALGDVVIAYAGPHPPPGLAQAARAIAPPFSPALAAAGQALILASRPGLHGLVALAWTHSIHVSTPRDPLLRAFVEFWLGRGASGR